MWWERVSARDSLNDRGIIFGTRPSRASSKNSLLEDSAHTNLRVQRNGSYGLKEKATLSETLCRAEEEMGMKNSPQRKMQRGGERLGMLQGERGGSF